MSPYSVFFPLWQKSQGAARTVQLRASTSNVAAVISALLLATPATVPADCSLTATGLLPLSDMPTTATIDATPPGTSVSPE